MRPFPSLAPLTAVVVGVSVLAGCAGAGTPSSPTATASAATPGSSSPSAAAASASPSTTQSAVPSATPTPSATASVKPKDTRKKSAWNEAFTVDGVPVISKKHPINADYRRSSVTSPYGLTKQTQAALTRLTRAAAADGVRVLVRSGYRSYALQQQILQRKIVEYGSEELARRYNAAPGRSEHQTGLAVDLWDGVTWGVGIRNTKIGKWLWKNAWKYGFILRYPNGKEKITGYAFEPWHYRYVGRTVSEDFGANSNLTLEEYLGLA